MTSNGLGGYYKVQYKEVGFFFSGLLQYILCENQDVETRLRTIFSGLSIQNRNNYSFLLFSCCFFVA